ncbi:MAG: type I restriction-modification enzyme R subunit C-terminal domain-containing protein, partial [Antarcticimicrobium sp.]|uniref:type I restriction-modification enzyme R subunit C-terminal domain-containing protein n=1 Tax=Antarcticimicrobium sp. TaxID=2824147 RepID=UPI00262C7C97
IVIDEAHRSVYRKYRAIFEYFDSFLIGLTATPKDEIDHDTYSLFNLERGVPTDAYDLEDAVEDGYLVPPRSISVPLRFQRDGIAYDQLSEEEKDEWDALDWDEDGTVPDRVESNDLNKWLFNKNTVDKVLEHLMRNGIKVAGGDRLGKTIIFAKNSRHAQFIVERFDANYPHLAGTFARLIDYSVSYAQTLIDEFSEAEKAPHIAVSVDMMDTGIDVPEVVNLVFFKIVRSKTKFWQMVGRGTRLCPDLFSPGEDKEEFLIFDFCQNLEFFRENPDVREAAGTRPIGERLFATRVELIGDLQEQQDDHSDLLGTLKSRLRDEVMGMSVDNFMVRDKRRAVELFQDEKSWATLDLDARMTLSEDIAGLPSAYVDDPLPAKQFDLLILNAQLLLLRGEAGFTTLQRRLITFASALEALSNIPTVAKQMPLILEMQTDPFWADLTVEILEDIRRRLRSLADLIQPSERKIVITNFEDEIGEGETVDLPEVGGGVDKTRFKMKVRRFIETHANHIALQKIHRGEPVTRLDLEEIETMLIEQGVADTTALKEIEREQPLGRFLRGLVGLDRSTAKQAFSTFVTSNRLNADQTEFIDMIIDHLTEGGMVEPARFYESPFSDIDGLGIEGVFNKDQTSEIIRIVRAINDAADAA